MLEKIIEYIKQKYNPLSIILYGSYANGTNNLNSDFDALVISYDHEQFHDTSFVNDIQLDVFVYPASYLQTRPQKTKAEMDANVDWCIKMLARVKRYDAEGMFRWHWVLIDSLEIFCDIKQHTYLGPKKALKWMEKNHPTAFVCYKNALDNFSINSLENWIAYIKNANGTT